MSADAGVLQRMGVQPHERPLFGWAALCLLLLGAAALALSNAAETLFLKRVGVERLPLALLASSGLLVLTTGALGRLAATDPARWLPWVLAVLAVAPVPFVWLAESRSPFAFAALLLISRQILALGALAFWLAMGSLVPTRRAKQLFAPLAAGITVGAIFGSFASQPLAALVGLDGLIALCLIGFLGAALAGARVRHSGTRYPDRGLAASTGSTASSDGGVLTLLRTSRLFRLLAVALLLGGVLNPILYFEFASVLDASTQGPDGEQRLLELYGQFRGWVNVALLVCQLWLSSVLYRRIGLPLSLAAWPAAYVIGLTWLGLDFALFAALASWGLAQVSEDGVSDSAARVLYNLFPEGVRGYATGLLEGPINRLGALIGNASVLGALAVGGVAWIGWVALPAAVFWLGSGLVLWRAYPSLLLRASAEHGLAGADIDRATLLDGATLRSLARSLLDPDVRMCRAAVDLMRDGEPRRVVPLLAGAIEAAPPANRELLVETLQRIVEPLPSGVVRSEAAARALADALRARPALPPEQRGDLMHVYGRLTGAGDGAPADPPDSTALLQRALGDRAAPVRLAAMAELHRRGAPPPGLPDLDRALADALAASDALVRRAARKELRAMLLVSPIDADWRARLRLLARYLELRADRADTAEALRDVSRRAGERAEDVVEDALRHVEDRDPRVRGALLALVGLAGRAAEAPRLVSALSDPAAGVAAGAREGLVALGPMATVPLLVGMESGDPVRRGAALSILRELDVDASAIDELRHRVLDDLHAAVLHRAALVAHPAPAASLLRRRLEERIGEGLGALLELLAALRGEPRLAELERRLRRSSGGPEHDLLVEAIESLLGRGDREAIVWLLEAGEWGARADRAADELGRRRPAPPAALGELAVSRDETTARLAAVVSLERSGGIGDPGTMPSSVEIAVRLQEVQAFDRLSTPQLMALADLLQEQKVVAGERIFGAGEEGLGLYFVLDGAVELRRGPLVLQTAGPGTFFGEIATLDGAPHADDAVAQGDARLLRLDRVDLLRLLEEAPALSLGLAQVLSARVRQLGDRLEAAAETR